MRVNVDDGPDAINHRVYLNDGEVRYCVEADDEAGYVLVARTDEQGRVVRDLNDEVILDRIEGIVRIEKTK